MAKQRADAAIDDLFGTPLAQFVRERNALAARLAAAGDRAAAASVKALAKPSISAWAVNQLSRHDAAELDALIAAGERARKAQARVGAGTGADELRARLEELRRLLLELRGRAARRLRAAGHAASDDTLERITSTLRTATQSSDAARAVRAGRLAEDVNPLGLAVLAPGPRLVTAPPSREPEARRSEARPARAKAPPKRELETRQARARPAEVPSERRAVERHREAQRREAAREREASRKREAARERDAAREREAARAEQRRLAAAVTRARDVARRASAAADRADAALTKAERAVVAAQAVAERARRESEAHQSRAATAAERLERAEAALAEAGS